jgi:hypothetical protein
MKTKNNNQAGKGSKTRPTDIQKYVENFDMIKWNTKIFDKKEKSK